MTHVSPKGVCQSAYLVSHYTVKGKVSRNDDTKLQSCSVGTDQFSTRVTPALKV